MRASETEAPKTKPNDSQIREEVQKKLNEILPKMKGPCELEIIEDAAEKFPYQKFYIVDFLIDN